MTDNAASRPRYHPATTKADWIAYSERLEKDLAERDAEISSLRKKLAEARDWMRPKG